MVRFYLPAEQENAALYITLNLIITGSTTKAIHRSKFYMIRQHSDVSCWISDFYYLSLSFLNANESG